jgi:hypothetical protein
MKVHLLYIKNAVESAKENKLQYLTKKEKISIKEINITHNFT